VADAERGKRRRKRNDEGPKTSRTGSSGKHDTVGTPHVDKKVVKYKDHHGHVTKKVVKKKVKKKMKKKVRKRRTPEPAGAGRFDGGGT